MEKDLLFDPKLLEALEKETDRVGGFYVVFGNKHKVGEGRECDVYMSNQTTKEHMEFVKQCITTAIKHEHK